jgi:hypothetical protein
MCEASTSAFASGQLATITLAAGVDSGTASGLRAHAEQARHSAGELWVEEGR